MLKTWNEIKSITNINKKEKKDINCLKVAPMVEKNWEAVEEKAL